MSINITIYVQKISNVIEHFICTIRSLQSEILIWVRLLYFKIHSTIPVNVLTVSILCLFMVNGQAWAQIDDDDPGISLSCPNQIYDPTNTGNYYLLNTINNECSSYLGASSPIGYMVKININSSEYAISNTQSCLSGSSLIRANAPFYTHPSDGIIYPYPLVVLSSGPVTIGISVIGSNSTTYNTVTCNYNSQGQIQNPLPVKLLSFSGHKDKNGHHLDWTTATEQNANHFEIQYSATGKDFVAIGNVRAAGNSNTPKYYDFTNQSINQSTKQPIYYYRLKMIDFDGSFEYSNTITIKEDGKEVTITAFPNPSETGVFTIQGKPFERTNAIVTNVLGQAIPAIIQNNQLNLPTLPAGVYFVRIAGENNTISVVKL